jgi:hypothetical protein
LRGRQARLVVGVKQRRACSWGVSAPTPNACKEVRIDLMSSFVQEILPHYLRDFAPVSIVLHGRTNAITCAPHASRAARFSASKLWR